MAFALLAGGLWDTYIVLNARLGRSTQRGSLALAMCFATLLVFLVPFGVAEAGSSLISREALVVGAAVGLLSTRRFRTRSSLKHCDRIEPHVFGGC